MLLNGEKIGSCQAMIEVKGLLMLTAFAVFAVKGFKQELSVWEIVILLGSGLGLCVLLL